MKELDNSLNNIRAAKKLSLEYKIEALQQLILQRFQTLTTISSVSFAVAGVIISVNSDLIKNSCLAILATIMFLGIAIISLGRHLYLIRSDINAISKKIKELPTENWNRSLQEKEFKADWWPEILYIFFVISILIFCLSFII